MSEGKEKAVEIIRQGHGILTNKTRKERNFYSFSTKYCFFHNKNSYPIFDSILANLLVAYNTKYKFTSNFTRRNLQDYCTYKRIMNEFRKYFKLKELSYEEFDHAMWIVGKYAYRKDSDKDYEWLNSKLEKEF